MTVTMTVTMMTMTMTIITMTMSVTVTVTVTMTMTIMIPNGILFAVALARCQPQPLTRATEEQPYLCDLAGKAQGEATFHVDLSQLIELVSTGLWAALLLTALLGNISHLRVART